MDKIYNATSGHINIIHNVSDDNFGVFINSFVICNFVFLKKKGIAK